MKRALVIAALLALLAGGSVRAAGAGAARPNILFILVDDLRWDALGCTGHPFSRTPNIDRLAQEGALFRNAFVTTPLCSPSRASFLTGQYVRTNGIRGNGPNGPRSHELMTFPRRLKDAGYETGYVGKWHMGNDDSRRPGFDRWVSFKGQGAHVDPELNIDGEVKKHPGYMTDLLTDHSVQFLKHPRTKPFCLYIGYKAVHGPFVPAPRHAEIYSDAPITRSVNAQDTNEGKPALIRPITGMRTPGPGTGSGDALIRNQLRMLVAIDEGVGRLLEALRESKQADNTLVIFTSDNGYFWGEHGLGDKRWPYEESIRVPLLARWPGRIPAGARVEAMALNVDIAPTALDAAGLPAAKEIHGRSLLPLFAPRAEAGRKTVFLEYFAEPRFARAPTWEAVRSERWKYIRYPELPGMDELYDLKTDPGEMKNRLSDPETQESLKDMKAELSRLLSEIGGGA